MKRVFCLFLRHFFQNIRLGQNLNWTLRDGILLGVVIVGLWLWKNVLEVLLSLKRRMERMEIEKLESLI